MATKPADFFIGVADFFAIILPGALVSYLAFDALKRYGVCLIKPPLTGPAQGWVAFAISSYLLGHFASYIGALLLDPLYEKKYVEYQKRHKRTGDQLFKRVEKLKDRALRAAGVARHKADDHKSPYKSVTPYKWARMSIRLQNASAMQEIDRLEADSKFFRSATVVLLISLLVLACEITSCRTSFRDGALTAICILVFVPLSFVRFSDLRWKAAEAAYLAVLSLERLKRKRSSPPLGPSDGKSEESSTS